MELPDFLNDLNAAHQAERHVPAGPYFDALCRITGSIAPIRATAKLRGRAILMAAGEWEE